MAEVATQDTANLPANFIADLEKEMLQLPQAECSVIHHFGPGLYVREVSIPAGVFAIGHEQKYEHLNVFLKGRVLMLNDDGSKTELVAPMMFVGKPGRKVGLILEDMVWQNIYATEERDVEKLESHYLNKSEQFRLSKSQQFQLDRDARQPDRVDYDLVVSECGFSPEAIAEQVENEYDQIPFPTQSVVCHVSDSPIHGKGLFASTAFVAGDVIAPARIAGMRTPAGRYTNHAATPNAEMVMRPNGDIDLVAKTKIDGCKGGGSGDEITIDYRQALSLSGISFTKRIA